MGDCGIDRYVDVRADRVGGISLNFAANALRCFAPEDRVGVLTVLGDDPEGDAVAAAIQRFGLDATITRLPGMTPVQYIDRDAAGERHFVRYEAGVLAEHRLDARDRAVLAASDVVITTVFNGVVEFFESVMAAPSPGLRALDYCNTGPDDDPLAYVRRYADRFDVGFIGLDPQNIAWLPEIEAIARAAGRPIVVTLGPRGAVAVGGAERIACPALQVPKVVDTTGAGDTFAAGFLGVWARDRDMAAALAKGTAAAARTLGHLGAFAADLVPWRD